MSITIADVKGERIFDSRGVPTLRVTVVGSDGSTGSFSVPSGASTGANEAYELRDDATSRGDVTRAISLLESEIRDAILGKDITAQKEIDTQLCALDGTKNKHRLGGNTLIGVSIALLKAAAMSSGKEVWQYLHDTYFSTRVSAFPRLYANLINGGKHAATRLAFQEYHVVPKVTSVHESLDLISRIQNRLYEVAYERYGTVIIGDEGGYALPLDDVRDPLVLLEDVALELGIREQVDFALDVASSSFFTPSTGVYEMAGVTYTPQAMMDLYEAITAKHHLLSIEDPFQEEDFDSFTQMKDRIDGVLRVGDDLTTTNIERLTQAVENKSIDSLIIKPNQIGTLTETIETMLYAHAHNVSCIVSHRSGETLDDFIADLAYASGAYGIKAGARGPQEREAKYSRLLVIEAAQ